jgi:hypothetical protein
MNQNQFLSETAPLAVWHGPPPAPAPYSIPAGRASPFLALFHKGLSPCAEATLPAACAFLSGLMAGRVRAGAFRQAGGGLHLLKMALLLTRPRAPADPIPPPPRGIGNVPLDQSFGPGETGPVKCVSSLGGLLNSYYRDCA